jgi:tRNA nucleotidyltransferase/poly(A) polymerase
MTDIKRQAIDIAKILIDHGYTTYLAGGCVRDSILGKEPKDYDIATEATPDQILELFPNADTIGAHFGVIMVKDQGEMFEIATFRTDGSYSDNRRPDSVEFTNAEEDCKRRDFTINGIFEDPVTGELIDYVGGVQDLKDGILRCIGNPSERFQEDALRMMRAVRFATVLNFPMDVDTQDALRKHRDLLDNVSVERINIELVKILSSTNRGWGVLLLMSTGLLNSYITITDEIYEIFLGMYDSVDFEVCLAVLFKDRKNVEQVLLDLRFTKNTINKVLNILEAPELINKLPNMPLHWRKRFYASKYSDEQIAYYRCVKDTQELSNAALVYTERFRERLDTLTLPTPLVNGTDLLERGYKAGKEFSVILTELYNLQLDGILTTKDEAIGWLDVL